MKKIFMLMCLMLVWSFNLKSIHGEYNQLQEKKEIIEWINKEYSTYYYILDRDSFYETSLCDEKSYEKYIKDIEQWDNEEFKNELIQGIDNNQLEEIDVKIEHFSRSSYGSKSVNFNSNRNKMTLSYKYSGSTYDTSYKPKATVTKLSNINYFEMSSYTGSFKNSNKTYSVVAKGRLINVTGIVNNKSFTVNFNL